MPLVYSSIARKTQRDSGRLVLLSLLAALGLAACAPADTPATVAAPAPVASMNQANESQRLTEWLDAEYAQELDFSPLAKTRLGDKSAHGELDDVSEAASDAQLEWRRDSVARLRSEFDYAQLNDEAKRSFDLWVYQLTQAEESIPFRRHGFIFGRNGPQASLPNSLINYQVVDTEQDAVDYVSRLEQSGRYLLQYLARTQLAAQDGVRAPFFDYQQALSEIERITSGEPFDSMGSSALWDDVTTKFNALVAAGTIDQSRADALLEQARTAILDTMQPAYEQISAWLAADLENVSDSAQGAWSLPDGEAYYQQRLERMTTLPLTADEIFDTGISEVARIQAEMEEIKARVGFEGSLQDFFTFIRNDDRFYHPNTDEGRAAYIADADAILAATYEKLPEFFGILPKAGLQVRRVEPFREQDGGAAHYARGTKDGSRPGTFYAHLSDMRAASKHRLENLAYHEGVPGHHMQISIQQELEGLPAFRANKGYTAYSEGWGLYAEGLGKEMGGYEDPYADFGRLSGEIWRAVRLVVDTGIHAKRWTQDEAVQYALENSPRPEPSVRSEIRRYFNNPGQATAYKIGMLRIQAIRAKAEAALGDNFDIRDFHDQVLGSGQLPMSMLEAKIDAWIEATR